MYKLILSVLVVLCFKITLSQDSKRNQIRDRIDACLEGTIHQNFIIKTQRHGYYIVTKETDLLENTCNPKVAIYRKDSGYQLKINGIKPSIICEKPEVVYENEIDGEFEGWDGDTVFKMVDGQVYQQLNHDYFYHYAYHPKVLIFKYNKKCFLKLEGIDKSIEVIKTN